MDIMDEMVSTPTFNGGKSGFNSSDVNAARRLIAEGHGCNEIARAININVDVVERFMKAENKAVEPKKAKKVKKDDDAS